MIIIQNSEYIKAANEVLIPSLCGDRGTNLFFVKNGMAVTNVSSYTTQAGYYLSYNIKVDFIKGDIITYCSSNTWGLSVIPLSLQANTIFYR